METPLNVAIIGCGLMGAKRAAALGHDNLVGVFDIDEERKQHSATALETVACTQLSDLFDLHPDVVIISTIHRDLSALACEALSRNAHVLVEKPAGMSSTEVSAIQDAASRSGKLVKVGFNHRFHPGIYRAVTTAISGEFGPVLYLRGRYGHGGRLGYESEWRTDANLSGGGESVDQGMHLLDLSYWLLGPTPLHAALLRTQFWNVQVDDNAVFLLGNPGGVGSPDPFSLLHVSWTEWKNTFSIEIACRDAKFAVDGLVGSYGPQVLKIYRMEPTLGPPTTEEVEYPNHDDSWEKEWQHFTEAIRNNQQDHLLGDLGSAHYAWTVIEAARSH